MPVKTLGWRLMSDYCKCVLSGEESSNLLSSIRFLVSIFKGIMPGFGFLVMFRLTLSGVILISAGPSLPSDTDCEKSST